ncbi:MAG: hypothetical protein ACTTKH_08465 [Treponema sp.]
MYSSPYGLEGEYSYQFQCSVSIDYFCYYEYLYQKNPTMEELVDPNRFADTIAYDLSFLTWDEMEALMEKSLKEGKDLLFEACKDKKVVITKEMKQEAWDRGNILLI